ncbi:DUF4124 domain-containing protein [Luteimonas soli]|uniref:DUF4124 domain-containing protein n=1 Tax=Luteimonas soli TaxID=1648966 RepID=A0ABV7XJU7_9GAMM
MVTCPPRLLLLLLLAASVGGAFAQEGDITIYRCTDAGGHLTVQDSPCGDDQSQQTRRMIQPSDPPPRAEPVAPAALQPAPEPSPQPVVATHDPRPMYECIRDDGSRYTSDDGEGNPRWISNWSSYGGPWRRGSGATHGRSQATPIATTTSARSGTSGGNGPPTLRFRSVDPTPPPPTLPPPGHGHGHHGHGYGYGSGGYWVHDECHALPQREVCARLRDRREQIRQRRFNAQANERATLNVEERGISARLSEDCGGA